MSKVEVRPRVLRTIVCEEPKPPEPSVNYSTSDTSSNVLPVNTSVNDSSCDSVEQLRRQDGNGVTSTAQCAQRDVMQNEYDLIVTASEKARIENYELTDMDLDDTPVEHEIIEHEIVVSPPASPVTSGEDSNLAWDMRPLITDDDGITIFESDDFVTRTLKKLILLTGFLDVENDDEDKVRSNKQKSNKSEDSKEMLSKTNNRPHNVKVINDSDETENCSTANVDKTEQSCEANVNNTHTRCKVDLENADISNKVNGDNSIDNQEISQSSNASIKQDERHNQKESEKNIHESLNLELLDKQGPEKEENIETLNICEKKYIKQDDTRIVDKADCEDSVIVTCINDSPKEHATCNSSESADSEISTFVSKEKSKPERINKSEQTIPEGGNNRNPIECENEESTVQIVTANISAEVNRQHDSVVVSDSLTSSQFGDIEETVVRRQSTGESENTLPHIGEKMNTVLPNPESQSSGAMNVIPITSGVTVEMEGVTSNQLTTDINDFPKDGKQSDFQRLDEQNSSESDVEIILVEVQNDRKVSDDDIIVIEDSPKKKDSKIIEISSSGEEPKLTINSTTDENKSTQEKERVLGKELNSGVDESKNAKTEGESEKHSVESSVNKGVLKELRIVLKDCLLDGSVDNFKSESKIIDIKLIPETEGCNEESNNQVKAMNEGKTSVTCSLTDKSEIQNVANCKDVLKPKRIVTLDSVESAVQLPDQRKKSDGLFEKSSKICEPRQQTESEVKKSGHQVSRKSSQECEGRNKRKVWLTGSSTFEGSENDRSRKTIPSVVSKAVLVCRNNENTSSNKERGKRQDNIRSSKERGRPCDNSRQNKERARSPNNSRSSKEKGRSTNNSMSSKERIRSEDSRSSEERTRSENSRSSKDRGRSPNSSRSSKDRGRSEYSRSSKERTRSENSGSSKDRKRSEYSRSSEERGRSEYSRSSEERTRSENSRSSKERGRSPNSSRSSKERERYPDISRSYRERGRSPYSVRGSIYSGNIRCRPEKRYSPTRNERTRDNSDRNQSPTQSTGFKHKKESCESPAHNSLKGSTEKRCTGRRNSPIRHRSSTRTKRQEKSPIRSSPSKKRRQISPARSPTKHHRNEKNKNSPSKTNLNSSYHERHDPSSSSKKDNSKEISASAVCGWKYHRCSNMDQHYNVLYHERRKRYERMSVQRGRASSIRGEIKPPEKSKFDKGKTKSSSGIRDEIQSLLNECKYSGKNQTQQIVGESNIDKSNSGNHAKSADQAKIGDKGNKMERDTNKNVANKDNSSNETESGNVCKQDGRLNAVDCVERKTVNDQSNESKSKVPCPHFASKWGCIKSFRCPLLHSKNSDGTITQQPKNNNPAKKPYKCFCPFNCISKTQHKKRGKLRRELLERKKNTEPQITNAGYDLKVKELEERIKTLEREKREILEASNMKSDNTKAMDGKSTLPATSTSESLVNSDQKCLLQGQRQHVILKQGTNIEGSPIKLKTQTDATVVSPNPASICVTPGHTCKSWQQHWKMEFSGNTKQTVSPLKTNSINVSSAEAREILTVSNSYSVSATASSNTYPQHASTDAQMAKSSQNTKQNIIVNTDSTTSDSVTRDSNLVTTVNISKSTIVTTQSFQSLVKQQGPISDISSNSIKDAVSTTKESVKSPTAQHGSTSSNSDKNIVSTTSSVSLKSGMVKESHLKTLIKPSPSVSQTPVINSKSMKPLDVATSNKPVTVKSKVPEVTVKTETSAITPSVTTKASDKTVKPSAQTTSSVSDKLVKIKSETAEPTTNTTSGASSTPVTIKSSDPTVPVTANTINVKALGTKSEISVAVKSEMPLSKNLEPPRSSGTIISDTKANHTKTSTTGSNQSETSSSSGTTNSSISKGLNSKKPEMKITDTITIENSDFSKPAMTTTLEVAKTVSASCLSIPTVAVSASKSFCTSNTESFKTLSSLDSSTIKTTTDSEANVTKLLQPSCESVISASNTITSGITTNTEITSISGKQSMVTNEGILSLDTTKWTSYRTGAQQRSNDTCSSNSKKVAKTNATSERNKPKARMEDLEKKIQYSSVYLKQCQEMVVVDDMKEKQEGKKINYVTKKNLGKKSKNVTKQKKALQVNRMKFGVSPEFLKQCQDMVAVGNITKRKTGKKTNKSKCGKNKSEMPILNIVATLQGISLLKTSSEPTLKNVFMKTESLDLNSQRNLETDVTKTDSNKKPDPKENSQSEQLSINIVENQNSPDKVFISQQIGTWMVKSEIGQLKSGDIDILEKTVAENFKHDSQKNQESLTKEVDNKAESSKPIFINDEAKCVDSAKRDDQSKSDSIFFNDEAICVDSAKRDDQSKSDSNAKSVDNLIFDNRSNSAITNKNVSNENEDPEQTESSNVCQQAKGLHAVTGMKRKADNEQNDEPKSKIPCKNFQTKWGCLKSFRCPFLHSQNSDETKIQEPTIRNDETTKTPQSKIEDDNGTANVRAKVPCKNFQTKWGCLKSFRCPFLHSKNSDETKIQEPTIRNDKGIADKNAKCEDRSKSVDEANNADIAKNDIDKLCKNARNKSNYDRNTDGSSEYSKQTVTRKSTYNEDNGITITVTQKVSNSKYVPTSKIPCKFFRSKGGCMKNKFCPFSHAENVDVQNSSRLNSKDCPSHLDKGNKVSKGRNDNKLNSYESAKNKGNAESDDKSKTGGIIKNNEKTTNVETTKSDYKSKSEDNAKTAETTKSDNKSKTAEIIKSDNKSKTSETAKTDDKSKTAETIKSDNKSKAAETTKSDDKSKTSETTKSDDKSTSFKAAKTVEKTKKDDRTKRDEKFHEDKGINVTITQKVSHSKYLPTSKIPCRFFRSKGGCMKNKHCPFSHSENVNEQNSSQLNSKDNPSHLDKVNKISKGRNDNKSKSSESVKIIGNAESDDKSKTGDTVKNDGKTKTLKTTKSENKLKSDDKLNASKIKKSDISSKIVETAKKDDRTKSGEKAEEKSTNDDRSKTNDKIETDVTSKTDEKSITDNKSKDENSKQTKPTDVKGRGSTQDQVICVKRKAVNDPDNVPKSKKPCRYFRTKGGCYMKNKCPFSHSYVSDDQKSSHSKTKDIPSVLDIPQPLLRIPIPASTRQPCVHTRRERNLVQPRGRAIGPQCHDNNHLDYQNQSRLEVHRQRQLNQRRGPTQSFIDYPEMAEREDQSCYSHRDYEQKDYYNGEYDAGYLQTEDSEFDTQYEQDSRVCDGQYQQYDGEFDMQCQQNDREFNRRHHSGHSYSYEAEFDEGAGYPGNVERQFDRQYGKDDSEFENQYPQNDRGFERQHYSGDSYERQFGTYNRYERSSLEDQIYHTQWDY